MKKICCVLMIALLSLGIASIGSAQQQKTRIFVVSSYSKDYLWSQDTNKGVCAGLIDFKFLDTPMQTDEYTKNDYVETDKTVVKKAWMDTKHKNSKDEIAATTMRVTREINDFKPDLILLGDDNATNYIGNKFLDTPIPVVFWGVDGYPLKYGLLGSIENPGHNVTGVYQPGYYKDGLEAFAKLVPNARSFAILSDDSETGRAKVKEIHKLAASGALPLKLAEKAVLTNSFSEFQREALRLQDSVDAFFVVNHNTMKDDNGNSVDTMRVGAWYLHNIKKPEVSPEKQFVQEGMLICADDSGYKQGYEAMRMADMILHLNKKPADIPSIAPTKGAIIVNRERAQMLGIDLTGKSFIEEYVDKALALQ